MLDFGALVLSALELENLFALVHVACLDVVCDGETIHGGFTERIADVVQPHLVFICFVCVQSAQVIDHVFVGVGLEVGEVHDIVIRLESIVELKGVQLLETVFAYRI